jgi:hypothetical protein
LDPPAGGEGAGWNWCFRCNSRNSFSGCGCCSFVATNPTGTPSAVATLVTILCFGSVVVTGVAVGISVAVFVAVAVVVGTSAFVAVAVVVDVSGFVTTLVSGFTSAGRVSVLDGTGRLVFTFFSAF